MVSSGNIVNLHGKQRRESEFQQIDEVLITPTMVTDFAKATGDWNPIHFDAVVARKLGLDDVIAHGVLLTGLVSRAIVDWSEVVVIPGKINETKFCEPAYIGSKIFIFIRIIKEGSAMKVVDVEIRSVKGNVLVSIKKMMLWILV